MNGWTIPTTVFLVAGLILCASLLAIHYGRRLAAWWQVTERAHRAACPECRTRAGVRR